MRIFSWLVNSHRLRRSAFLFLVIAVTATNGHDDNDGTTVLTPCSQAGQDYCALTNEACRRVNNNKVVLDNDNDNDNDNHEELICFACLSGFVRLGLSRDDDGVCVDIEQNLTVVSEYVNTYNVTFMDESVSEEERLVHLQRVARLVTETNLAYKPYTLTLNEFSAETPTERDQRNGLLPRDDDGDDTTTTPVATFSSSSSDLPDAVDWVQEGKVTVVKNQLFCGCCWSVAAAGAIESKYAIDNDVDYADTSIIDTNFSFQQMISCNTLNSGCQGGNIVWALEYAHDNKFNGLASWVDFPYQDRTTVDAQTSVECNLDGFEPAYEPPEARMVLNQKDKKLTFEERLQQMKKALVEQPVAIAMSAECDILSAYRGGVLTEDGGCACSSSSSSSSNCLNHAVLMVGYNDTHNPPYLLIKNSWGERYGEDGYFRVAQTPNGDWGLFGVLAEGVFPSNNEEYKEAGLKLKWWQIILITIACLVVVFGLWAVIEKRRQTQA